MWINIFAWDIDIFSGKYLSTLQPYVDVTHKKMTSAMWKSLEIHKSRQNSKQSDLVLSMCVVDLSMYGSSYDENGNFPIDRNKCSFTVD